jgi:hypothetical protein
MMQKVYVILSLRLSSVVEANNRQQRMEGFKPSIRYTPLIINTLVFILLRRLFNDNPLMGVGEFILIF